MRTHFRSVGERLFASPDLHSRDSEVRIQGLKMSIKASHVATPVDSHTLKNPELCLPSEDPSFPIVLQAAATEPDVSLEVVAVRLDLVPEDVLALTP